MNAVNGFASTWLPLQQEHDVGRKAFFDLLRGDLHRGVQWTDDGVAGDFAMSPWQLLPAGDYTALLQVWSEHAERPAGQLIAEDDAGLLDELHLAVRPVLMGKGEALWAGLDLPSLGYEAVRHVAGARAMHVFLAKRGP